MQLKYRKKVVSGCSKGWLLPKGRGTGSQANPRAASTLSNGHSLSGPDHVEQSWVL